MQKVVFLVFVTLLFVHFSLISTAQEFREWKSSGGTFTVEAELVSQSDESVKLKKKNGKILKWPELLYQSMAGRDFGLLLNKFFAHGCNVFCINM